MIISEEHRNITLKLAQNNICVTSLDSRSLDIISQYMKYDRSVSDLIRRLSDVELNYVQIYAEADKARESFLLCKENCIHTLKSLIDDWSSRGYIQEYYFTVDMDQRNFLKFSYSTALEEIRNLLNAFTSDLIVISETAAQLQACSASFFEIYKESKLAIYAAMLNNDVESALDCRSLSLQSHASSNECSRTSSYYLGVSRIITRIISIINSMIIESTDALSFDIHNNITIGRTSPYKATSIIRSAISKLDEMRINDI